MQIDEVREPSAVSESGSGEAFGPSASAEIAAALDTLNAGYADSVLLVARHARGAADIVAAELLTVDRRGLVFSVHDSAGASGAVRFDFGSVAEDVPAAIACFYEALYVARAAVGDDVAPTSLELELSTTATLPTCHGVVVRTRELTPDLREVTVGGFDGLELSGGDEYVYVLVSHAAGGIVPGYTMDEFRRRNPGDPVRGAYYTVRRHRPAERELDLWAVVHDHPDTVASWFLTAQPGDHLALWGPRHGFVIPQDATDVLMIADASGFAAVAALIDTVSPQASIVVVLEVVDREHRVELPPHTGLEVVWVERGTEEPGCTNRLARAVEELVGHRRRVPDAVFGAGESRQVSAIRTYLRHEIGIPAQRILITGYWRSH